MSINWYPGHMATARKAAAESMRKIDLVIEVLDARVPHSSCNPIFERLEHKRFEAHFPHAKPIFPTGIFSTTGTAAARRRS